LRLTHLEIEVVAFACSLSDPREDRDTTVRLGDVVDELLDEHRLADARAAEQADFAALPVGSEEVDDLDSGLENLDLARLIDERWRVFVDGRELLRLYRGTAVDGGADDVKDAAEALVADGHHDRLARVSDLHPAHQAVRRIHRDGAHRRLAKVL